MLCNFKKSGSHCKRYLPYRLESKLMPIAGACSVCNVARSKTKNWSLDDAIPLIFFYPQ
jgi:hypothetical protein